MRSFLFCLMLGMVWPLSEVAAQRPRVPSSEEDIVAALRSTDIKTIDLGISGAMRIGPKQWTPTLRRAILYALESEIRRDEEAIRAGVQRFTDDNLQGPLSRLAAVMQDPAAIPLLALTADATQRAALIAFGRQALPDLMRVAREEDYYKSTAALIALRQMVQAHGLEYFTPQERAQLKAVAALYLSPDTPKSQRPHMTFAIRIFSLYYAAQLILLLEDAEGRTWVEALAADPEALQKQLGHPPRGHSRLQDLLNGAPMLPLLGKPLSEVLAGYREMYGHHWDQ